MALINGKGYSFTSLQLSLLGNTLVVGFRGIEYRTTQAKQNVHGAGGSPVERTHGQKNYEGSITLTVKEVKRIREAAGKRSLVDIPPFPVTVTYANGEDAATVDLLQYVEFTEDAITSADGDTSIDVDIPLVIGAIIYNQ